MKKTKQSSYNIDPVLLKQIKQFAVRNNTTLTEIIVDTFRKLTNKTKTNGTSKIN